ncbi:DUF3598 family protein [Phormidesmis priestleyi]
MMKSQWDCFLQNLGEWQGSFTRLSPQGDILGDTPSVLSLELDDRQTVHLNLRREGKPDMVLSYTTVGGGLKFFETGAFSQGTIQMAPFSQFGGELALLWGDRRLRLVQLFDLDGQLDSLTLIREKRTGSNTPERPLAGISKRSPLTLESLLGEWRGSAITIYADLQEPKTYSTTMSLHQEGDTVTQALSFGDGQITSAGTIQGSRLVFDRGSQPVQVLLLPDGASSTCPMQISKGNPLFLEVGWLVESDQRQRLIRSYNSKGEWVSLTLVTEKKMES